MNTSTCWICWRSSGVKDLCNFSIVDVMGVLTESADAAAYWRKLKQRLTAEGNETVTNCHGLKMLSKDGKRRLTDVANTEQLLYRGDCPPPVRLYDNSFQTTIHLDLLREASICLRTPKSHKAETEMISVLPLSSVSSISSSLNCLTFS